MVTLFTLLITLLCVIFYVANESDYSYYRDKGKSVFFSLRYAFVEGFKEFWWITAFGVLIDIFFVIAKYLYPYLVNLYN